VNKAPDAKEKFAAINGAYEILSDPEKRQMFDAGAMDADGNQQVLINSDMPLRNFLFENLLLAPHGVLLLSQPRPPVSSSREGLRRPPTPSFASQGAFRCERAEGF
jgi:curved DNA-binding protein CbpA